MVWYSHSPFQTAKANMSITKTLLAKHHPGEPGTRDLALGTQSSFGSLRVFTGHCFCVV